MLVGTNQSGEESKYEIWKSLTIFNNGLESSQNEGMVISDIPDVFFSLTI